jgi:acetyltransferase-like isoleucine patch superfamily enzyme
VNIWGRAHRFHKKDILIWDQFGVHGKDDQGYDIQPVVIGEGVWIGPLVTVFRGVTIGEGAVIGANSVVTKDIPAYAVAWGVPAMVQKYRV